MDADENPRRNAPCPCGSGKRYKHCCGAPASGGAGLQREEPADEDASLDALMQTALRAQRANDLEEAQKLYRMALERSPDNVDALHMLGVVHFSKGELALAEGLIAKADVLSGGAVPAISHNLSLVRASAGFDRGEWMLESLLSARAAQREYGFDHGSDVAQERSTRLIAFHLLAGEGRGDERVFARQAALARENGISGFCFCWHGDGGGGLIESARRRLVESSEPDLPYCLCLIDGIGSLNRGAPEGDDSDAKHDRREAEANVVIGSLMPHFSDRRYIRVGGRPLLVVARTDLVRASIFDAWRTLCRDRRMEAPFIVAAAPLDDGRRASDVGADALAELPRFGDDASDVPSTGHADSSLGRRRSSYLNIAARFLAKPERDDAFSVCIVPTREGSAHGHGNGPRIPASDPAAFELWLRELIYRAARKPRHDERIVFLHAWNDRAHGRSLEPDERDDRECLDACRNARLIPRRYQGVFGSTLGTKDVAASAAPSRHTGDFPMVDLARPDEVSRPPAGDRAETCVVRLSDGGAALGDAPLLWRDALPERLVREHERALVTPPVEVFCIADAVLHGPGWASTGDDVLFDESLYPTYCRELYRRKQIQNAVDRDLGTLVERRFRAGWHVAHFNCGVYGHWLLEVVPKLFAIREFLRRWPECVFMPIFVPSIFPEFVYDHTRALLPYVPIVPYDPQFECIRAETLFMPTWGVDHVWNSMVGAEADAIRSTPVPEMPKRMFVSRRRASTFRTLDNRQELERIAVEAGFTTVYPEDHPLRTQIALFRNAAIIVGEFGSALHNALFAPRDTIVVSMNWINACQSRIARFRRHRIGYLLPESGSAVLFDPDAKRQHYAIDPDEFRAKLREAIGQI